MSGIVFDSGEMGNPRYQIDALPREWRYRMAVRVQLNRHEAEAFVRWYRPDIASFPIREVPDLADDETFLDVLIEAVHAWVGTCPALDAAQRRETV